MIALKGWILTATLACTTALPYPARAQAPSAPAAPAMAPAPAQDLLKAEQLDQLLAPIALYPDNLLAQTLMASTYPLEVVEASRWVDENKKLKGDQLRKAVDGQTWDESVKSLVATPSVLDMMSTKLSWTQKLGDAVLAQQPDVMDAVQRLRARAQAAKKLETTKEQKVSRQDRAKQAGDRDRAGSARHASTFPTTTPPWFMAHGPMRPIRRTTSRRRRHITPARLLATGLAFGAGVALGAWAAAALLGRRTSAGAITTSTSIVRPTSTTSTSATEAGPGSTTRNTARASATTTPTSPTIRQGQSGPRRRGRQDRMDFRGRGGEQVLRPGVAARVAALRATALANVPAGGQAVTGGRQPAVAPASAPLRAVAAIGQVPETGGGGQRRLPQTGRVPADRGRRSATTQCQRRRRWRP